MRRNVRRLNREVNDGQPNHQHIGKGEYYSTYATSYIVYAVAKLSSGTIDVSKKGRSRKAANLAELQRYFTAAAEAASEVLNEGPLAAFDDREDLTKIAEAGIKPLDSPRCAHTLLTCNKLNIMPSAAWLPSVLRAEIYDFGTNYVKNLKLLVVWPVKFTSEHHPINRGKS